MAYGERLRDGAVPEVADVWTFPGCTRGRPPHRPLCPPWWTATKTTAGGSQVCEKFPDGTSRETHDSTARPGPGQIEGCTGVPRDHLLDRALGLGLLAPPSPVPTEGVQWSLGQGSLLDILGAGSVRQEKLELIKKQGPSSLQRVQPLSLLEIFQVLVVCENLERVLSPHKPMAPLLQGEFYREQLSIPHVIVGWGWGRSWVGILSSLAKYRSRKSPAAPESIMAWTGCWWPSQAEWLEQLGRR